MVVDPVDDATPALVNLSDAFDITLEPVSVISVPKLELDRIAEIEPIEDEAIAVIAAAVTAVALSPIVLADAVNVMPLAVVELLL